MDDNKNIEKVSRTVFDKFRIDAPDNAWDKLDADLDKKQAVVYKQRASRFKWFSIVLILIIFSYVAWQYLMPSTTKNSAIIIPETNTVSSKETSNIIVTESKSTPSLSPEILVPSKSESNDLSKKRNNKKLWFNKSNNLKTPKT